MSATVIIPTTGNPLVVDAVESVLAQSYPTECLLVVDGEEYLDQLNRLISKHRNERIRICSLPKNVGRDGYYGHRIYAGFTHLIDSEYVMYLDQDNWLESNHVHDCVELINKDALDWCFALRNIYEENEFVCQDNCESLGKWPSFLGGYHIDTNTFFLKTNFAIKYCSKWHGKWGQDRVFFSSICQDSKWDCTNKYTVNYRLGGNIGSVTKDFFLKGNLVNEHLYNGSFPWLKNG